MDYGEFAELPDRVKIEARLSWLEWKMLDMLWLLISLTSLLVGAIAAWLTRETIGNRSLCDDAAENIGVPAWPERNDHTHRSRRIGLRPREA